MEKATNMQQAKIKFIFLIFICKMLSLNFITKYEIIKLSKITYSKYNIIN